MGLRDRVSAAVTAWRGQESARAGGDLRSVRADIGGQSMDLTDPHLAEWMRDGSETKSGAYVNERTALGVGTAWRCASIICGTVASLPCDLMLREGENARAPAANHPFRDVLTLRPNNRQTPSELKTMLQLHRLQRGDGFAMKIVSRGKIIALWPLDPNRMDVIEAPDNSLVYRYTRRNGSRVDFAADEILHQRGLSWDGVRGLPVIRFMAEALGLNIQSNAAAAKLFRNGQFTPGFLKTEQKLSDKAFERLKESRDKKSGVDSEDAGKLEILEEGLEYQAGSLSAVDAQLIEIMGFSRTDIGMFYGVPPHLYGDTDKSTSWGSGIEQQNIGFLQYTIQPHLTTWAETLKRDCLSGKGEDPRLYVHFDIKGFLRADAAGRSAYLARALGGGGSRPWMTQNEARAAEDMSPRPEKWANELPEIGSGRITENVTDPNSATPNPDPIGDPSKAAGNK